MQAKTVFLWQAVNMFISAVKEDILTWNLWGRTHRWIRPQVATR